MKKKVFIGLGFAIAGIALVLSFVFDNNHTAEILSIFIFAVSFSISFVNLIHDKMLKTDKDYRISIKDERSEIIRDKVNAAMSPVFMFMNSLIAVISFINGENIAAVLLLSVTGISPIAMHFINKHYENIY